MIIREVFMNLFEVEQSFLQSTIHVCNLEDYYNSKHLNTIIINNILNYGPASIF